MTRKGLTLDRWWNSVVVGIARIGIGVGDIGRDEMFDLA